MKFIILLVVLQLAMLGLISEMILFWFWVAAFGLGMLLAVLRSRCAPKLVTCVPKEFKIVAIPEGSLLEEAV